MAKSSFEILDHLPAYGPMWIPIGNSKLTSDGFVVRFNKDDGSSWVGNFDLGHGTINLVQELSFDNLLLVIAQGQGYIINPNCEKCIKSFGCSFEKIITDDSNRIILVDSTDITVIESTGELWVSDRISYWGVEVEMVKKSIIYGQVFTMEDEAIKFTLNLESKRVTGGYFT